MPGDASGKKYLHREHEKLQMENINNVNPPSQIPVRNIFQKNLAAFKTDYQPSRVNLVPYSQINNGNAKITSFSYTEPKRPMDVIHDHVIQPKTSSGLTGDNSDAKNRYAFQRVQQKPNVFNFARSLKSNEALVNGMYAPNVNRSGHFLKSKPEIFSDSPQTFEFNAVELRKNISVQPVIRPGHTERISTDYMFRNVNHDMKNNGSILNDNRNILPIAGQNEKTSRKVIPVSKSLAIVRANKKVDTPSPHVSATETQAVSQLSNDNIRPVGLSKIFAPQNPAATAAMPKSQAFTKSHSDGIQSILPLKKAKFFSFQRDQVGQQDYTRNISPKASQQSTFGSTNVNINAFKGFQRHSQDAYQNSGQSQYPIAQDLHSQRKYDSLAEGASAIRPPTANIARSYKGFPSSETNSTQTIEPKQSTVSNGKAIYSSSRIQLAKTPLVISEPKTTQVKIKLPSTVTSPLWMSSQHSTGKGNHPFSSRQSTAQSLFIKNPVPDDAMKISQSISQSVSGTYKNSDMSTSQNRPYYLTSKKPYAFKGFTFFPTEKSPAQQTETYSGPKLPPSSLSNAVRYASAHPRTAPSVSKEENHHTRAQNPLISNSLTKTLDAVRAHDTVSSTSISKHYRGTGQASLVNPSSTNIPVDSVSNHEAFYLQNNLRERYNTAEESQFNKRPLETSQRWTSGRLAPAQNTQAFDKSQTVLGLRKSSLFNTTSERSTNGRFARPNTYRNLFMKSNNVSSVSSNASNALNTYISTVATGTTNANTFPEFPSVSRKTGVSQGTGSARNIQVPTRHGSIIEFNSDNSSPLSHFVPSIHRSTVANKVTGYPLNAGVQPQSSDVLKNIMANPTMDRNAGELTQLNTNESYNVLRLRPTSSVVIGRQVVEANKEGGNSEKSSVYAVPTSQSAIYRSASIHKAKSSANPVYLPTIHRSVIKPYGKAKIFNANMGPDVKKNETRIESVSGMDIDLSTVGVSQTLRPTSSFVVGKFVKALEKAKSNFNASQTKGLQNFKPVRFADIAGSASFSNIKASFSTVVSKAALRSIQNISTSTPGMDESFTELPFAMTADSFTVISDLQEDIENDSTVYSTVSINNLGFMQTAVTTDPQLSFTEVSVAPQTTVFSSELEPDPLSQTTPTAESVIPFYEGILIPNTTMLVTMTPD